MPYTVFISLGISAVLLFLSLLFRLAGKFRLTLPLLYFLLTATVLNPWAAAHETLAFAILFCLLALSVISWLFSLRNAIRDRKLLQGAGRGYELAGQTCQKQWNLYGLRIL